MHGRRRQLLTLWRVAAAWLLVLSVVVGPLGLGASVAWAKTCGVACPCDDGHTGQEAAQDHQHNREGQHHDGLAADHPDAEQCDEGCPDCGHEQGQGDEDCPEDCPDCDCGLGVLVAVVPPMMPSVPVPYDSLAAEIPPEAPLQGTACGVYRPPRSST